MAKSEILLELEKEARRLGRKLKKEMPPGCGFGLVLFTFGDGDELTYLSSANRSDMINVYKELIQHLEGQSGLAEPGAN
jgi:hypothetical protein